MSEHKWKAKFEQELSQRVAAEERLLSANLRAEHALERAERAEERLRKSKEIMRAILLSVEEVEINANQMTLIMEEAGIGELSVVYSDDIED